MKSVRLFDFIQFDGAWQVVAHDGAELALKNLATGRIRRVPVAELLSDDAYLPDAPPPLPDLEGVALLETLEPGARAQAELLHRHVYELVSRTPPDAAPGISVLQGTAQLIFSFSEATPSLYGAIFGLVALKLVLGTVLLAGRRRPAP